MAEGKLQALHRAATSLLPENTSQEDSFSVQCFSLKPVELPAHVISSYSVMIHLSAPVSVEWLQSGRSKETLISTGGISLHSIGELPGFRLTMEAKVLEISLSPLFVHQTLQDATPPLRELKNVYGIPDAQIRHIGLAMRADREAGCPTGRLFGDSLAAVLTSYLFSQYLTDPVACLPAPIKLSSRNRYLVQEYLHAHLAEDVTLKTLAALTSYSPHHFALLFKQTFGASPHQYVIRRRVEEARCLLGDSEAPLSEIAYRVGFANQSHFSLCFKRLIGTTPNQYREAVRKKSFFF